METRNEVFLALNKYGFLNGAKLDYFSSSPESIQSFLRYFNEVFHPFEKPDAFFLLNNEVLIIEHFSIDGYKFEEHAGSLAQLFQRKFDNQPFLSCGKRYAEMDVDSSYAFYIENVMRSFDKHYKHIDGYKQHLIDDGFATKESVFKVCFLIDDTSIFGSSVVLDDAIHPICLAQSQEFLSYYKTHPDVNWVLSARVYNKAVRPYLLSYNEIDELQDKTLDFANGAFIPWKYLIMDVK